MYKSTLLTPEGPTPSRLYPIWNFRESTTRLRPAAPGRGTSAGRVLGAASTVLASRSSGLWDTKFPFTAELDDKPAVISRAGEVEFAGAPKSAAASSPFGAILADGNFSGRFKATLSRTSAPGPATGCRDSGAPGRGTARLAGRIFN